MFKKYTNQKLHKDVPMYIWKGEFNNLRKYLNELSFDKIIIFSDSNVLGIYKSSIESLLEGVNYNIIQINPGEKSKNFETFVKKSDEVLSQKITSKTIVILFGGGVVGNLWWLISSTLLRWIRFIHIPTTFLSQSDSCMWWKQGINTSSWKNTIWSVVEPEFIVVDFDFLKTLNRREILNGISESIKHAIIQDEDLFNWYATHDAWNLTQEDTQNLAEKTLLMKLNIMEQNDVNKGIWSIMKYGHEVWHAIEMVSNNFLHGEAVSIGIVLTTLLEYLAWKKDKAFFQKISETFTKWWLPIFWGEDFDTQQLCDQLEHEWQLSKEKGIKLRTIKEIGKVEYLKADDIFFTVPYDTFITVVQGYKTYLS